MSDHRVIIWDFDGTLGYRPGMWSQAVVDVVQGANPHLMCTLADVRPFLREGFPWHRAHLAHTDITTPEMWWQEIEQILERACAGVGCPSEQARLLAQRVHHTYVDPQGWLLYDDVLPVLAQLQEDGWRHVILSNHVPELPLIVHALGLSPYITDVFTSALLGYEKPHPKAFHMVKEQLNNPRALWMIGDNVEADVIGAEASGIPAILVRREDARATRRCADVVAAALLLEEHPMQK